MVNRNRFALGLGIFVLPSAIAIAVASHAAAENRAPPPPITAPVGTVTYGNIFVLKSGTTGRLTYPTLCPAGQSFLLSHVAVTPYAGAPYPSFGRWVAYVGTNQSFGNGNTASPALGVFGDNGQTATASLPAGVAFGGGIDFVLERPWTQGGATFYVFVTGSCGVAPVMPMPR